MNANWIARGDGDDGEFELMIVTSDDRQHVVAPSPADRRLIAANLRGTMPWTEDPATPGT
jgi:hypothetical protein